MLFPRTLGFQKPDAWEMETLGNDANHISVAKEQSTTFGDAQSHVQIHLSAEGGHILLLVFLSPEWGTHLDRPDWWA